ncbi:MAG: hypothetical protein SWY16_25235 [Cyanobacteriota bacterium]|nr:hypothetical protein [Cyanobacteriota bacterium]
MSEEKPRGIWIVTADDKPKDSEPEGARHGMDTGADYSWMVGSSQTTSDRTYVTADDLKQSVAEFLDVVEEAFQRAEKAKSGMQLDEIELSVEVGAEGQLSLLGTGGKAGGKGAIKLKFSRRE